jgi:hypothetical protein
MGTQEVSRDLSNAEIGRSLSMSEGTVKTHVNHSPTQPKRSAAPCREPYRRPPGHSRQAGELRAMSVRRSPPGWWDQPYMQDAVGFDPHTAHDHPAGPAGGAPRFAPGVAGNLPV